MSKEQFEHEYDPEYASPELYCPFCERYSTEFLPTGLDIPVLKEKNVVSGGYRLNATCSNCGSIDRERLIYLYLRNKSQLFYNNLKILHVAPEANLQKVLMAQPNIEYLSADISSPLAMVQMDITDIKYEDNSFDVVICNHVLEHIPDDRKAMGELYRVLKPGHHSVISVPSFNYIRRTKYTLRIYHLNPARNLIRSSTVRRVLGREPFIPRSVPWKSRLYTDSQSFWEYLFSKSEFEEELRKAGFTTVESVPIALMDGIHHEFGARFVPFRNWAFHPTRLARLLNSILGRIPFCHNHMHLCVVRKE